MTERALGSAILQLPRSKFRILFALDAGVVKDEFQVFLGRSEKRLCAAQSRSELAPRLCDILHSGWGEKFAKAIGEEKARSYLSRISYGNMDPSTKGGAYWVDGKLAISAEEQVVF